MKAIQLFAKSRNLLPCLAFIIASGIANTLVGKTTFRAGSISPVAIPLSMIIPVIVVTGILSIGEPNVRAVDKLASRPIHRYQTATDALLLLCSAITLHLTTVSSLEAEFSKWSVIRNLVGLAGIGWTASTMTRQTIASGAPILIVLIAATLGRQETLLTPAWSWLVDTSNTYAGWITALSLLALGLTTRSNVNAQWATAALLHRRISPRSARLLE